MKMISPTSSDLDAFYSACKKNDIKEIRKNFDYSWINLVDIDGNTALHIASSNGYIELIELLFRYHASRKIKNKKGLTAEEVTMNDETKNLFKTRMRPKEDSEHFVGSMNEVEWIDSYKNAYRIAYENREHMKRWLLKVPLTKLLEEFKTGYIENMKFASEKSREKVTSYLEIIIEDQLPVGLIWIYSDGGTSFCTKLNEDLAEIGSDFRFLSTQNLFNSGYMDNEPPKDLGQHIFTAILINHPYFQPYYRTGTTYRGMNIKRGELKQYKKDDIVLTRSFLSTSEDPNVAQRFKRNSGDIPQSADQNPNQSTNEEEKIPIICIYTVVNRQTSLYIEEISNFPEEKEVLIVPFAVFKITKIENGNKNDPVIINLEEVSSSSL